MIMRLQAEAAEFIRRMAEARASLDARREEDE